MGNQSSKSEKSETDKNKHSTIDASQYKTKEEALAAGISEPEIAEYLKNNPSSGSTAASPATAEAATDPKADTKVIPIYYISYYVIY